MFFKNCIRYYSDTGFDIGYFAMVSFENNSVFLWYPVLSRFGLKNLVYTCHTYNIHTFWWCMENLKWYVDVSAPGNCFLLWALLRNKTVPRGTPFPNPVRPDSKSTRPLYTDLCRPSVDPADPVYPSWPSKPLRDPRAFVLSSVGPDQRRDVQRWFPPRLRPELPCSIDRVKRYGFELETKTLRTKKKNSLS